MVRENIKRDSLVEVVLIGSISATAAYFGIGDLLLQSGAVIANAVSSSYLTEDLTDLNRTIDLPIFKNTCAASMLSLGVWCAEINNVTEERVLRTSTALLCYTSGAIASYFF